MFNKNIRLSRNFHFSAFKTFAQKSKIIIIGAGTGGVATAKQLSHSKHFKPEDITIFDPSKIHYYQPGWTKIGGISSQKHLVEKGKYNVEELLFSQKQNFNFQNKAVKELNPDNNTIIDENGEEWNYEQLIVSCGIKVNHDSIPGLHELLKEENNFVGTIYDANYCQKVAKMRENFKGGKAIFTQPPPPIKCGGGPQKIVYLCNDYWKKHNVDADVHFFSTAPAIFGVKYFSDALQNYANKTGVKTHLNSQLISVDAKTATFKNTTNGETFTENYDFLHVVPHMQVPDFLKGSKISNAGGFVDINMSMNHKSYKNVWAIGDCISLPNAKTAASVFSQVPVVVENLEKIAEGTENQGLTKYDGYASCPLYLEEGKLMLAEFKDYIDENGELRKEVDESFVKGEQIIPKNEFYNLGLRFAWIYKELGMRGIWYGKNTFFGIHRENMRGFYKYFVLNPYRYFSAGVFGFGGFMVYMLLGY